MLKRVMIWLTLVIFTAFGLISVPVSAQQDLAVVDKITAIETIVYGSTSPGSILDRVNRLETDIYGENMDGSVLQRADNLYNHIYETTEIAPSMLTNINAVEWSIANSVSYGPIQNKVINLEMIIAGSSVNGALDARIARLASMTFPQGSMEVVPAILPQDSLIKIKIMSTLNSKENKAGDTFDLVASEDAFIGSVLIIPKGAKGTGTITKAVPAKNFGRDAKLELSFDSVEAIDGSKIKILIGDKAKEETLSLAKATGASLAGMIVLGPVGIIGGAFISGKNINIPEGTEIYVQTEEDQDIYGVAVQ